MKRPGAAYRDVGRRAPPRDLTGDSHSKLMEGRPDRPENVTAPDSGSRGRFYAYTIAAVGATLAALVLAVVLLWPEGTSGRGGANATGSILFAEIHATVFVQPGVAGPNSVEIEIGRHDGATPEIRAVAVTVTNPSDGASLGEFDAEPEQGRAGTFRVSNLTIPTPGDWEFALSISEQDKEALSDATLITIGAASSAG